MALGKHLTTQKREGERGERGGEGREREGGREGGRERLE